jgi:hypothetical protein
MDPKIDPIATIKAIDKLLEITDLNPSTVIELQNVRKKMETL